MMIGFAIGSILTGRLSDRFGIAVTLVVGALAVGVGYILAGISSGLGQLVAAYALLGVGTSAGFCASASPPVSPASKAAVDPRRNRRRSISDTFGSLKYPHPVPSASA